MHFHHKHLPTFVHMWHKARAWYRELDFFEKFMVNFVGTGAVVFVIFFFFFAAPIDFPAGSYITVAPGATLGSIATDFKQRNVVAYATVFKLSARLLGNDTHIPAGVYYFPRPENAVAVAIRLVTGDFETTPVRITVPEGSTVKQISDILTAKMPDFNRAQFLSYAQAKEGYLFPDTYFFMPGDSTEAILSVFNNGFQTHIAKIQPQIDAFKKPLQEDLTMASLLEKEASDTESRRIIAGILWNRIKIGMPLQVDAVFPYILGKSATLLTSDDLKVDSPYNTYIHIGLPPGPIANPGLDSITDAVTPIKSSYLYYLSDKQGNFHYAATYAQFLAYKKQYIGS